MTMIVGGKAVIQIPIDTAALNPDSLKAMFAVAVESMESDLERAVQVVDWSKLEMALYHGDGGTTRLVLRGPIL